VTLFSALSLLQPTKGAIVGLQWQTGMHGFETSKLGRDSGSLEATAVASRASV
jgi:hypothetical protein